MKNSRFMAHSSWLMLLFLLFFGLTGAQTTGLVGYWQFDEPGGNTAYDSSGSGNDGTLAGGPTRVSGVSGQALDLDGTDDHVVIATNGALNNLTALTFCAWIYPRRDSHWHIVDKGDGDKRLYAEGNNLTLDGRVRDNPTHAFSQSDSNTVVLNTWQHVAMTWSLASDTTRLYRNGAEVSYGTQTIGSGSPLNDNSHPYTLGARGALGAVTFFDGLMDEVRIYNRVLSGTEIAGLYGSGPAVEKQKIARAASLVLSVSPNPFMSSATISFPNPGKNAFVRILDVRGRMVAEFKDVQNGKVVWNAEGFSRGVYIVKAETAGKTLTRKISLIK